MNGKNYGEIHKMTARNMQQSTKKYDREREREREREKKERKKEV